ncbi:hypothetical protein [Deinococcus sp. Leaf326]|jgi:hypothetical protein|uniref:hypothetical protein n=1 Tax=Deinococcus sp. Leaf326 TaxID=1736338 RepID=UPI0006F5E4BD|nr:hypothetical protein [Deinococcus sp. Leaf326]KQR37780.1 hypothetical protein ASF71_14965 [Deinococcus sp. Leaf326]
MIQNPVVADNTSPTTFPLVSAETCICCGRELSQGYDVPYVGVVGPKCVRKYAALAAALARLDTLTITEADPMDARLAVSNLVLILRTQIGYAVELVDNADGSKSIKVGARTRKHVKVCKTWKERRAEFELELQLAETYLAAQVLPPEAPALTPELLRALTPTQRRAVAAEYGVTIPNGRPSSSVTLIWTAIQAVQVAEAQMVAPVAPLATPEHTVMGPIFPHSATGPFLQLEQRQMQQSSRGLSAPTRIRLSLPERLHRLALEAKSHEIAAEAGSDARLLRGARADRLAALAWMARQGVQA